MNICTIQTEKNVEKILVAKTETKTRLILNDTISLRTYLETQKITMKDVRIDMKVESNEMKSAHFETSRIIICRLQVVSYYISNLS